MYLDIWKCVGYGSIFKCPRNYPTSTQIKSDWVKAILIDTKIICISNKTKIDLSIVLEWQNINYFIIFSFERFWGSKLISFVLFFIYLQSLSGSYILTALFKLLAGKSNWTKLSQTSAAHSEYKRLRINDGSCLKSKSWLS